MRLIVEAREDRGVGGAASIDSTRDAVCGVRRSCRCQGVGAYSGQRWMPLITTTALASCWVTEPPLIES